MINKLKQAFRHTQRNILLSASVIFLCGLFIHLGEVPLMSDEGIRGLVALEMELSGDYLAPTINGELYFNKPPLFNWILLAFFKLFDSHSLFVLRLPTVLASIFFTLTIFLYIRKYFGNLFAALNSLLFLSAGKILYSDTNLALLDLTHAWLLYLNFIVIIEFSRRNKYGLLFLCSYALIALCYLMKGLPALVAQAVSLLVFFIARKEFRKLISLHHVLGILVMFGIIGTYYYYYFQQHPGSFDQLFTTIWDQSSQRTAARYPWEKTITHLFAFPFKFLYEMLPVSLLAITCLRKDFLTRINQHPLLLFSLLFLLANSIIFWLSPYWRVRYIFMLFPLAVTIMLYFYMLPRGKNTWLLRITDLMILSISAVGTFILIAAPFLDQNPWPASHLFINFLLGGIMLLVTIRMIRVPAMRLVLFILLLSISRLAVSTLYLPVYSKMQKEYRHRESSIRIGQMMKGKELYLYGSQHINQDISYYITRETGRILYHKKEIIQGDVFYIADNSVLRNLKQEGVYFATLAEFYTRDEGRRLYLIRFI